MSYSKTITEADLTNILNEVLPSTGELTCESVTLPFTPTKNGLLVGLIRANATGRVYIVLSNTFPNLIDGYQTSQGYLCGTVFCQKNKQVAQTDSSNLYQKIFYFVTIG